MTTQDIFNKYGVTCKECKRRGIPYQTAYAHYKGTRKVTPQQAVTYEKLMGIPRTEFYPLTFWFPTIPAAMEDADAVQN